MARQPKKTQSDDLEIVEDEKEDNLIEIIDDDDDVQASGKKEDQPKPPDLQKQLDDLKAAEAENKRLRESAEHRAQQAERRTQELESRNSQSEASIIEHEYDSILNGLNAANTELKAAKEALKQAHQMGDYDAIAEAQERMVLAGADVRALENGKFDVERKREALKKAPQVERKEQPVNDAFEASIANFPDPAKNWLRTNREFMASPRNSISVQKAHYDAIDAGHGTYTPAYFEFIETAVGLRKAPDKKDGDDNQMERRAPMSAPVSRDPPSTVTGRGQEPQRVKLSKEEREIAVSTIHREGMKPGEAERIYAENKLKMQEAKKNGHYPEGGR